MSVSAAAKTVGITDQTFYRWRTRYGSMPEDEAKRLQVLDEENTRTQARARRAVPGRFHAPGPDPGRDPQRGAAAGGGGLPRGALPHLRAARLPARRTAPLHAALRHERPGGERVRARIGPRGTRASTRGPVQRPARGRPRPAAEPGVAASVSDRGTGRALADRRCRGGRRLGSMGPDDERRRPAGRAARIPFLDDRIPCFRRLRTSLVHDVVWLARDSETARLVGADASSSACGISRHATATGPSDARGRRGHAALGGQLRPAFSPAWTGLLFPPPF